MLEDFGSHLDQARKTYVVQTLTVWCTCMCEGCVVNVCVVTGVRRARPEQTRL